MDGSHALPELIVHAVERALLELDGSAAVEVKPMTSAMGMALLPSQVGAWIMGSAGILGLLLASVGLYGMLLYNVARRRREIGVRMALGAGPASVVWLVIADATRTVIVGAAIGLAIAAFVMKPLAIFLVAGLSPTDPAGYASVATVLLIAALAASATPSIRALRVDPAETLRSD